VNRIILEHLNVDPLQIERYLSRIRQRKELNIEMAIFKRMQKQG
jgi:hypothetical protein